MHAVRKDLTLGLTLSIFFCLVYFVLIPMCIEVPHSHDPGQLSPAAYPSWIAMAGLCASLLLTANAAWKYLCLRRLAASAMKKAATPATASGGPALTDKTVQKSLEYRQRRLAHQGQHRRRAP